MIKSRSVDYQFMSIESYGEHDLAIKTGADATELLNRRVEIFIR